MGETPDSTEGVEIDGEQKLDDSNTQETSSPENAEVESKKLSVMLRKFLDGITVLSQEVSNIPIDGRVGALEMTLFHGLLTLFETDMGGLLEVTYTDSKPRLDLKLLDIPKKHSSPDVRKALAVLHSLHSDGTFSEEGSIDFFGPAFALASRDPNKVEKPVSNHDLGTLWIPFRDSTRRVRKILFFLHSDQNRQIDKRAKINFFGVEKLLSKIFADSVSYTELKAEHTDLRAKYEEALAKK